MFSKWYQVLVLICTISLLQGCGGGSDDDPAQEQDESSAKYLIYTGDGGAYLNLFTDDGNGGTHRVWAKQFKNSSGLLIEDFGEVHLAHGKAFIIARKNFEDETGQVVDGGIIIIDAKDHEGDEFHVELLPLKSEVTGKATRPVHTYMEKDASGVAKYLWVNNDGLSTRRGATQEEADLNDSVFRIDIDPDSADYKSYIEIEVGNGHKKSAFSYPTDSLTQTKKLFVTHDLSSQTVSIIDNDASSDDFLKLRKQIEINTIKDDEDNLIKQNTPHGMAFSPVSGHVYTGITSGKDIALHIIDATSDDFAVSSIKAGMEDGQIPGAGYVKTSHDGRWVFTAGFVDGVGYLAVVDAKDGANTVTDVINLGKVSSSSFNVSEASHGDEKHFKVYIPSRSSGSSDDELQNVVARVSIDSATGKQQEGTTVDNLTLHGNGSSHRNGKTSPDENFVYYPNGCGEADDDNCKTISIIDTHKDEVVGVLQTFRTAPGSIGVFDNPNVINAEDDHSSH